MISTELAHTFIYAVLYLLLFGITELLYRYFKLKAEITRKVAHIGTGVITLTFPFYLNQHWSVLILSVSFILILWISKKYKTLPSINAIDRFSNGSVLYPIVIYINFLIYLAYADALYFYLPMLILALCDPLAALVGKKWPWKPYTIFKETKTLSGSVAFFLGSCFLAFWFISNTNYNLKTIISILVISLSSTIAEGISQKGWDNLFIPLTVIMALMISHYLFDFGV